MSRRTAKPRVKKPATVEESGRIAGYVVDQYHEKVVMPLMERVGELEKPWWKRVFSRKEATGE